MQFFSQKNVNDNVRLPQGGEQYAKPMQDLSDEWINASGRRAATNCQKDNVATRKHKPY